MNFHRYNSLRNTIKLVVQHKKKIDHSLDLIAGLSSVFFLSLRDNYPLVRVSHSPHKIIIILWLLLVSVQKKKEQQRKAKQHFFVLYIKTSSLSSRQHRDHQSFFVRILYELNEPTKKQKRKKFYGRNY